MSRHDLTPEEQAVWMAAGHNTKTLIGMYLAVEQASKALRDELACFSPPPPVQPSHTHNAAGWDEATQVMYCTLCFPLKLTPMIHE